MNIPRHIIRTPHSGRPLGLRTGFTLIELLVVITIIALLAGLIVGGAAIANSKKAQSRVTTERDGLITAIERYKKAKGFYPPDNTNDTVINPLFYELTGTVLNPNSKFQSPVTGEVLSAAQIGTLFNNSIGGFINSSADPSSPPQNFFGGGLRTSQYLITSTNGNNVTVLGVPVSGPISLDAAPGTTQPIGAINPWHYNYSHPTNNQGTYDLWMDVKYGGKTNRISNWSKDPQPL
jgi:prepilin-type N-terminal cleavage/methylation domain-containing protein